MEKGPLLVATLPFWPKHLVSRRSIYRENPPPPTGLPLALQQVALQGGLGGVLPLQGLGGGP